MLVCWHIYIISHKVIKSHKLRVLNLKQKTTIKMCKTEKKNCSGSKPPENRFYFQLKSVTLWSDSTDCSWLKLLFGPDGQTARPARVGLVSWGSDGLQTRLPLCRELDSLQSALGRGVSRWRKTVKLKQKQPHLKRWTLIVLLEKSPPAADVGVDVSN